MGLLRHSRGYDRSRILDAATRARARKQRARAIELYRWVLAFEPGNPELHGRLAPLLAETGQHFDAWLSFHTTAKAHQRDGLAERALAVYREAASYLPQEYRAWEAIARIEQQRGRDRDATEALLEGRRQLRSRFQRPQAIYLLRRARAIEPWNFEVVLELARLLARTAQREEARLLLRGLAERTQGERLRRVLAAELILDPGPRQAWRWLRALMRAEEEEPAAPAARPPEVLLLRRVAKR